MTLLLVSCHKPSNDAGYISTKKSEVLRIGNGREPVTLDPHRAASWADLRIIEGLFEGLLVIDPWSKEPIGGVAKNWQSSADGLRWRFDLREEARWSDGSQVTAHDFLSSAKRMLNPEFGSDIVVHLLYSLANAENYHRGVLNDFQLVGIKAADEHTLVLDLQYPNVSFLTQLSYFFPVKENAFPENKYWADRSQWGMDGATVSNGAYQLMSWVTNEGITLKKNPFYWDKRSVSIEQIDVLPIDDVIAEERAFRAGQIHVTSKVPVGKFEWYQTHEPQRLRVDPRLGLFFIQLNHNVYPLDDPRVRLALAKCVNREAIVEAVLKDGKLPASWIVPSEVIDRDNYRSGLSYDPSEAQSLLADAGFSGGTGFPRVTITINTSATYQALAEALQFEWRTKLGIHVDIENLEWKAFLGAIESKDFQLARYGYVPLYPDAYPLFQIFTTEGTENFTGWSNEAFDELVAKARGEVNLQTRNRLLREAEKILVNEAPVIPVFFYNSVYLIDDRISGWEPDLMDRHPFKFLRFSNR